MFVVEGNIGSGKSTLLKMLADQNIHTSQEPVADWLSFKDNTNTSVFDKYYNNPSRYAYVFQMHVMLTRLEQCKNNYGKKHVSERSVFTDKNIFADMLHEQGVMDDIEHRVFLSWFRHVVEMIPQIKGWIYLRVDPETCFERVRARDRQSEDNISLDFLKALHEKHEQWFLKKNEEHNVLIIEDNDQDAVEKILTFINNNETS